MVNASDTPSTPWVAFHIFYHADIDSLLLNGVKPIMLRLRQEGCVSQYFFVRYWNGGPHLRLRTRLERAPEQARLRIAAALEGFLGEYPGGQGLSLEEYSQQTVHMQAIHDQVHVPEVSEPLQAPDSVQLRDYEFDADRYGRGPEQRMVSEEHFFRASEMAMFAIGQTMGKPGERVTLGLYLTAALACALGLDPEAASQLFGRASKLLRILYPNEGADLLPSLGYLPFKAQLEQLEPLFAQLTNGGILPGASTGLQRLLALWQDDIRSRLSRLHELRGSTRTPPDPNHVVLDYMHMMNNRLGISVVQECYAYHVLAMALRHVNGLACSGDPVRLSL